MFFTNDRGEPLLLENKDIISRHPELIETPFSLVPTHESADSVGSVVPDAGKLGMPLKEFCDYIDAHQCLQQAEISSTECYAEQHGAITHRFLILELRRRNRRTIWLRLDRRLGKNTSTMSFLRSLGVTEANDVVGGRIGAGAYVS
jgi:hypothetical protein